MSVLSPGRRHILLTGGRSRARPGLLRFEPGQPSAEACSDALARQLWNLSAQIRPG